MPFVEIKQAGPDIPDGAYPVILTAIDGEPENPTQPRHVVPENGPNVGKDLYFWDWKFKVNIPGEHPLNGTELKYGTSTSTGPRSKMFGLLTALLNGTRPSVGMKFEQGDLIGRQVYATVQRDEAGYCEIVSFSPIPAHLQQQAFAQATGTPTQGTPVPGAQPAAAPVPGAQPGAAAEPQFQPQQIVPPMPGGFAGQVATPPAAPARTPDDSLPF